MANRLPIEMPNSALEDFYRRHNVRKLAFFGSVLRGDFDPESNVE